MAAYNAQAMAAADVFPSVAKLRVRATELQAERSQLMAASEVAVRRPTVLSLDALDELPAAQQRHHLEREVETVWVKPATRPTGPKFDASRVHVQWVEDHVEAQRPA